MRGCRAGRLAPCLDAGELVLLHRGDRAVAGVGEDEQVDVARRRRRRARASAPSPGAPRTPRPGPRRGSRPRPPCAARPGRGAGTVSERRSRADFARAPKPVRDEAVEVLPRHERLPGHDQREQDQHAFRRARPRSGRRRTGRRVREPRDRGADPERGRASASRARAARRPCDGRRAARFRRRASRQGARRRREAGAVVDGMGRVAGMERIELEGEDARRRRGRGSAPARAGRRAGARPAAQAARGSPATVRQRAPSRRRVLRTALTAMVGSVVPSVIDLNGPERWRKTAKPQDAQAVTDGPMTFAHGGPARRAARRPRPSRARPSDLPPELAGADLRRTTGRSFPPGRRSCASGRHFARSCSIAASCSASASPCSCSREAGPARPLAYDPACSTRAEAGGPELPGRPGLCRLPSALRLRPAGRPRGQEEFLVFLGASYFRLRGKGQEYGLSARGAAIDTGPGRRGVSRLHRPLDLRAGARRPHDHRALAARQPEPGRRLPLRHHARRSGAHPGHGLAPPAQEHPAARARAADQHVPARPERAGRAGGEALRRLPAAGARFRRAGGARRATGCGARWSTGGRARRSRPSARRRSRASG